MFMQVGKVLVGSLSSAALGLLLSGACAAQTLNPAMVANAKAQGMLAKVLYVVFTRGVDAAQAPKDIDRQEAGRQHIEYQKKLEKDGIMFAAGPLVAEGVAAQGMIVIRANSPQEARAIADADPMHKLGLRTYSLGVWQINEGTMSVRVNFSNGTYSFE